jgi:DsbC/DsbD-like thiol-disulfide interchange protein
MHKILLLLLPILLWFFLSQGQVLPDPTHWTYEAKKVEKGIYELVFKVELNEGWHIFSLNPGDELLIPPSFTVTKPKDAKLLGRVTENENLHSAKMEGFENEIKYHEGFAIFTLRVAGKAGLSIEGSHEYQVCNETMCLPPKTAPFKITLP